MNNIELNDCYLISLVSGGFAIVDKDFKEVVDKSKWRWCSNQKNRNRVISIEGDPIQLHNLIVPFEKVTFKNGNKADCRKENLLNWCEADISKMRHSHLYKNKNVGLSDRPKRNRYQVFRQVKRGDQEYIFSTSISYGKRYTVQVRSKEEAYKKAIMLRDKVFSLSRNDFIKWVLSPNSKRFNVNRNEIIKDWTVFEGKERSVSEIFESGMSHYFERD